MYRIFSLLGPGIMDLRQLVHLNGCGVRVNIAFQYSGSSLVTSDFVISKVTPQLLTALGFKIFMMFGAINIGAMGLFSA